MEDLKKYREMQNKFSNKEIIFYIADPFKYWWEIINKIKVSVLELSDDYSEWSNIDFEWSNINIDLKNKFDQQVWILDYELLLNIIEKVV